MATYLQASAMAFPALMVWIFASKFLLPRLEWLWQHTKLGGSKAQFLVDVSYAVTGHPKMLGAVILLLFLALEGLVPQWPRFRRPVTIWAAIVFQTFVLIGLLAIACGVVLVAQLLAGAK